jgi:type II secretory pathway component PulC
MKLNIRNNKLKLILLFSTIIIWGIVFFNIFNYLTKNNSNTFLKKQKLPDMGGNMENSTSVNPDTFITIIRDPFNWPKQVNENKIINRAVIETPKEETGISFKIRGIIIGETTSIVFEDLTNNKILYLSEGSKYLNISIRKILTNKVLIMNGKNWEEYTINGL